MTDLHCTQCGLETTYADALIADNKKTCYTQSEKQTKYPKGTKHNWVEEW